MLQSQSSLFFCVHVRSYLASVFSRWDGLLWIFLIVQAGRWWILSAVVCLPKYFILLYFWKRICWIQSSRFSVVNFSALQLLLHCLSACMVSRRNLLSPHPCSSMGFVSFFPLWYFWDFYLLVILSSLSMLWFVWSFTYVSWVYGSLDVLSMWMRRFENIWTRFIQTFPGALPLFLQGRQWHVYLAPGHCSSSRVLCSPLRFI